MKELFVLAAEALTAADIGAKLATMDRLEGVIAAPAVPLPSTLEPLPPCPERGQFAGWTVVLPRQVPRRDPATPAGRAALLHAIAHIEYSAIDLALDHTLRFPGLPGAYYRDWIGVAIEEARHFRLLRERLQAHGADYGDFPVHDTLWRMAEATREDVLVRMALVPRLLEARGLDATPPLREKLARAGDEAAVAVLDVILADEIGHVGLGDRWFRQLCRARGLVPEATYRDLLQRFRAPWPQQPMNRQARLQAGFSAAELDDLTAGPSRA